MLTIEKTVYQEEFEDNILEEQSFLNEHNIISKKAPYPFNYPDSNYYYIDKKISPSVEAFQDIFNSIKINKKEEENEKLTKLSSDDSLILFNIVNYKKRGKKSKKTKKVHLSSNFDNLQRKIQVHFLTFVINLSNDVLKSEFGYKTSYNFKQIDYELKKIISHNYFIFLKTLTIKELLLKMRIYPKNKNYPGNINITTLS